MATITMGSPAINRINSQSITRTLINANNPANEAGKITSIEIYADGDMTAVEIAIFYLHSAGKYSTRSNVTIGNVSSGEHSISNGNPITVDFEGKPISLSVNIGDLIGIYGTGGAVDRTAATSTGMLFSAVGDYIPCVGTAFTLSASQIISLGGTGATLGWSHKWNGVTISKWNGQVISKLNGLQ